MNQIVWLKWTYLTDDMSQTNSPKVEWKLHDISLYSLKTVEWKGHYRQYLQWNWKNENGYGTEEIDLKDYPRLTSKEHLILLCNIERPYVPKEGDVIEHPYNGNIQLKYTIN